MNRKVELLAPAGSIEAFYGAVNAGADAIYLAGNRFGARAYAKNFEREELIGAIKYAHIFGVKVYLTINTLFKNRELDSLGEFLTPFYTAGLDGVIVQDLGVFAYVKELFPQLELHVSTQMAVTSLEGAALLTEMGAKRIVPARELSMDELKKMCEAGIEVESFIHGSMCYCYSGQCLFSSLIGARSGNRGRCAQPCRLSYQYENGKNGYCFSLKDMCTIEYLPEILSSGIASLKIEGRMKHPAYAAGVTAIYRKYIDRYFANPEGYSVEKEDLNLLKSLYIRSQIQDGYYRKNHGAGMITYQSPSYSKTPDALLETLTNKYILPKRKLEVSLRGELKLGKPALLSAEAKINGSCYCVFAEGDVVMKALKSPLVYEDVCKRFEKGGDTVFSLHMESLSMDESVFLSVKALNELRRTLLSKLEDEICMPKGMRECGPDTLKKTDSKPKNANALGSIHPETDFYNHLKVFVENTQQLQAAGCSERIENIVIPTHMLRDKSCIAFIEKKAQYKNIFLRLPAVCRDVMFEDLKNLLQDTNVLDKINGFYVNQIDSVAFIKKNFPKMNVWGDINLYAMNVLSVAEVGKLVNGYTIPVELNKDEIRHMPCENGELIIYGRYPLMNTANCVFLTHGDCRKAGGNAFTMLKDRMGERLPVKGYCGEKICYNTVYNSVVTSLHKQESVVKKFGCGYQIRFLEENADEVKNVLELFHATYVTGEARKEDFAYTNGHFKRGVE